MQVGPHTVLDEGINRALDLMQESAAVNAIFVYSHMYHDPISKPPRVLASDHGVPIRDQRSRKLPSIYVKHNEAPFKTTFLRHQVVDRTYEYADRDLFRELVGACRQRNIKLYARQLEDGGHTALDGISGLSRVVTRDVYGRPTTIPCWNHPDYRAFWIATAEDLVRSYELDGFQWGSERHGPLMNVLLLGRAPFCFCEHCLARSRDRGIDCARARAGFEALHRYVTGKPASPAGVFGGVLRILLQYPEILAWEYQYRLSREEMEQAIYGAIKGVNRELPVGWHISHQQSSYDVVYRAEVTYAEMAPYSDFIKMIVYHDILGPRIRWWYLDRLRKTIFNEVSLRASYSLYLSLFGFDPKAEPALDKLETEGFSPDYVYRETKRSVASTRGLTKIYPGIGFDVPWNSNNMPADPEEIYRSVIKAFEAGADGIVISREYEEMRVPNLKAVGRAMRELK